MAVTTRTIIGRVLDAARKPTLDGEYRFTPTQEMVTTSGDFIPKRPTIARFTSGDGADAGKFTVDLIANDSDDLAQTAGTWRVQLVLDSRPGRIQREWNIVVPKEGSGTGANGTGPIELGDLTPVTQPGEVAAFLTEAVADERYVLANALPSDIVTTPDLDAYVKVVDLEEVDLTPYAKTADVTAVVTPVATTAGNALTAAGAAQTTANNAQTAVANKADARPTAINILRAGLAVRSVTPCRIVFTGSSTTEGRNASTESARYVNRLIKFLQNAYPVTSGTSEPAVVVSNSATFGTLSTLPAVHGYNVGEGGTTAATYLVSAERTRIAAINPRAIIHMVGSNDWGTGRTLAAFKADVQTAVNDLKSKLTVPCVQILVNAYRRMDVNANNNALDTWENFGLALKDIADADPANVAYIDLNPLYKAIGVNGTASGSTDPLDVIDTDLIHQNDNGHAFMADLLAEALGIPRASASTTTVVVGPPAAPTITTTAGNASSTVSWSAPASNGSAITGYKLYRSTSTPVTTAATLVASPAAGATSFSDSGLTNGTTYYYGLIATNANGDSGMSNSAAVTPAVPGSTTTIYSTSFDGAATSGGGTVGDSWVDPQTAYYLDGSGNLATVAAASGSVTAFLMRPTAATAGSKLGAAITNGALSTATTPASAQPVVAADSASNPQNYYCAVYSYSANKYRILKATGGAAAAQVSTDSTDTQNAPALPYKLEVRVDPSNNTVSAYLNGGATPVSTYTDSALLTGRFHGLRAVTNTGSSTAIRVADYEAKTYA